MMKRLGQDAGLLAIVFAVWAVLATLYATVPMIYMPNSIRVWGAGAGLFLVLAILVHRAESHGRKRR